MVIYSTPIDRHSISISLNNDRKHTLLMLMQREVYQISLEFECCEYKWTIEGCARYALNLLVTVI
jgi:hypothetical protein